VSEQDRRGQAITCYRQLLQSIEGEQPRREGLRETPARAAAALDDLTRGYAVDIPGLFTTFEAEGYDEMVVMRGVPFYSLCEHHLLPFAGTAALAYIPNGRIVGLSKLARLVDAFARRLQVQERLTTQIADALVEHLSPKGVMVIVEAEHLCMAMRGVEAANVPTVTSAVRGAMQTKPEARAEALALLTKGSP
jgi:GTP cyclohydrolase I